MAESRPPAATKGDNLMSEGARPEEVIRRYVMARAVYRGDTIVAVDRVVLAALVALVAERDRYRTALEEVAALGEKPTYVSTGGSLQMLSYYSVNGSLYPHQIARAALVEDSGRG